MAWAVNGSLALVVGQMIWNAAQVGFLLLLSCLWISSRDKWTIVLSVLTILCLPFAIYAISPGALPFFALIIAASVRARIRRAADLAIEIVDSSTGKLPFLAKVEVLGFACNLFCSMYNYNLSRGVWPRWASIYAGIADFIGFTAEPAAIARSFYSIGLSRVHLPSFIAVGDVDDNLGALVFLLIWTILPFLYVLYFLLLAKMAKDSPGTRLQQALCVFAILHFLFLTDLVDYRFGRGIANPFAEWGHWSERFVWRIAILLPLYQNLVTGHWRRKNGVLLHYALIVWALAFFVNRVLMFDLHRFFLFVTGSTSSNAGWYYLPQLSYPRALVLMTLVYGFAAVALRCKEIRGYPWPGVQRTGQ